MKSKFHAANEKPQHALMRGPSFYFFWRGRPGIFILFLNSLVPDVFPSCSHEFLSAYQNGYSSSQVIAQDVPNSASDVMDKFF